MKHPHCNRSHGAHLFWCRGFAPIFFILAVALIVVSVGSGIYFATKKSTPAVAVEQPVSSAQQTEVATTTPSVAPPIEEAKPIAPPSSTEAVAVAPAASYINCGSSEKAAKCLTDRALTCLPAKGIVTDPSSGLKVERIIDGYKGNDCSYRSSIISGTGSMAVLVGMNVNCMIPKAILSKTMQGGFMTQEDMFALCSGTFIDLMRAQQAATQ
jgi:hypothetical protein